MTRTRFEVLCCVLALIVVQPAHSQEPAHRLPLTKGWTVQSSARVAGTGESISTPGYSVADWIPADVPTTVVAAQVKKGLLPDPFFGMNLRQYPGVEYPIGHNFSGQAMPAS